MSHKLLTVLFFSTFLTLLNACKTEKDSYVSLGKEYMPLRLGQTLTYDVDSVIYDPQSNNTVLIDTHYWQIKEVLKDSFRDLTGVLTYKVERWHRLKGASQWEIDHVLAVAATDAYFIREDNNLRFIKLPLVFGNKTTWDGNAFIDPSVKITIAGESLQPFSKKWTYQIVSLGVSEKIGNKTYPDILTVQAQTVNILNEKRSVLEKYARDIGLVYREEKILDTQKLDANIAWEKRAEKGYILTQRFID